VTLRRITIEGQGFRQGDTVTVVVDSYPQFILHEGSLAVEDKSERVQAICVDMEGELIAVHWPTLRAWRLK